MGNGLHDTYFLRELYFKTKEPKHYIPQTIDDYLSRVGRSGFFAPDMGSSDRCLSYRTGSTDITSKLGYSGLSISSGSYSTPYSAPAPGSGGASK